MTPENAAKILNEPRYDTNSAAAKLGCSRRSLERYRNSGKIKYVRLGGKVMHTESQLAEFVAESQRQAIPEQQRRKCPPRARKVA